MKKIRYLSIILIFALASCGNQTDKKNKVILSETKEASCTNDPGHSYQLYIPAHNLDDQFPLLIVLDPHGEGNKALDKFVQVDSKPEMIMAASNLIQNNFPGYEQAISDLIEDVKSKFPVDRPRVFLAGFSGGARMALSFAGQHKVAGVIACGAFVNDQQLQTIHCPVYGLVGNGDFNFMEYANALLNPKAEEAPKVALNIFDGIHEWPDKLALKQAVQFMEYLPGLASNEERQSWFDQQTLLADSLFKAKSAMAASFIFRNLQILFPTGKENKKLKSKLDEIYSSEAYKKNKNTWIAELQQENKLRKYYMEALASQSLPWWMHEKDVMDMQLADPSYTKKALLKRIQSFWGIVLYSQVNSTLKKNDLMQASHLLQIYTLLEPANPDTWYYRALYAFKNNEDEKVGELLAKADSLGFSDRKRLESDFPGKYWMN
ncbi:MAG: hypothetical protein K9H64_17710 [Bacteroidales bacterium]|nr:hypothetical protein [Bacteroidales bacterium]MCF8457816.1 hypothetical protein [Bacteroidales bacterium]